MPTEKMLYETLKNWYQIAYEIKHETNQELKSIKQATARLIYNKLNDEFLWNKSLFQKINSKFNAMSIQEIVKLK